jgi:2-amino-4-hydroxy-6-hydroxymethyldihydropteridine diphosphokinase
MVDAVTPVAIALGSNVGDRESHLQFAVQRLAAALTDLRVSHCRNTSPVGVGPQPTFLNAAAVGATRLDPLGLLDLLLTVERERGRERPCPGAPRTLDLDLILYGSTVLSTDRLTVPHPRFRQRAFVLEPLADLAPDLVDPVTGLTMRELWQRLVAGSR